MTFLRTELMLVGVDDDLESLLIFKWLRMFSDQKQQIRFIYHALNSASSCFVQTCLELQNIQAHHHA